jgi:hypothetical protein
MGLKKAAKRFLIAGPIIALAPAVLALVLVQFCPGGASSANESNCSAAALPWLLILSIPFGILLFIAGTILLIIAAARSSSAPKPEPFEPPQDQD